MFYFSKYYNAVWQAHIARMKFIRNDYDITLGEINGAKKRPMKFVYKKAGNLQTFSFLFIAKYLLLSILKQVVLK